VNKSSFEELIVVGEAADVTGWDFSWLAGRATEERPSWGYAAQLAERLGRAGASLDIQTGGGEVLAEARSFPRVAVATESWPPNILAATRRLHPRGVVVVADPDEPPLPFADAAFDLVSSRHPATSGGMRSHGSFAPGVATLRNTIYDVAAVVYLLRKVIWWVPDFTVERYRSRLHDLHDRIERDGQFVTYSTRHLIEARRQ
jgi:hypothetical protein